MKPEAGISALSALSPALHLLGNKFTEAASLAPSGDDPDHTTAAGAIDLTSQRLSGEQSSSPCLCVSVVNSVSSATKLGLPQPAGLQ